MFHVGDPRELAALHAELEGLRAALVAAETVRATQIGIAHPSQRRSVVNLLHYVELRNHDIRNLQTRSGALGLSSLGR